MLVAPSPIVEVDSKIILDCNFVTPIKRTFFIILKGFRLPEIVSDLGVHL